MLTIGERQKRKRMIKKANIRINEGHNKSFLENFMDHPPINEKNLNDFFGRNRKMSDEKKWKKFEEHIRYRVESIKMRRVENCKN
jgi:hypothetical protein